MEWKATWYYSVQTAEAEDEINQLTCSRSLSSDWHPSLLKAPGNRDVIFYDVPLVSPSFPQFFILTLTLSFHANSTYWLKFKAECCLPTLPGSQEFYFLKVSGCLVKHPNLHLTLNHPWLPYKPLPCEQISDAPEISSTLRPRPQPHPDKWSWTSFFTSKYHSLPVCFILSSKSFENWFLTEQ